MSFLKSQYGGTGTGSTDLSNYYTSSQTDAYFLSANTELTTSLSGLTDVTISNVVEDNTLIYDGTEWVNTGISFLLTTDGLTGDTYIYSQTQVNDYFLSANTTIGDLSGYTQTECDNNFLSANTAFYGIFTATRGVLGVDETWDITTPIDNDNSRMIQVYKDPLYANTELDYDLVDESLFVQEDTGKTDFVSGAIQLYSPGPPSYAHWYLNESSGTTVSDSSGNGRSGTTVNGPTWVAGKLNNCLDFDYLSTQYVNFGDIANFDSGDTFSLECWFNTTIAGDRALMGRMNPSAPYTGWEMFLSGGKVTIWLINNYGTNDWFKIGTTSSFNDNTWHHVILTYNGSTSSTGVTIYVDGSPVATSSMRDTLYNSIKNTANCEMGMRGTNLQKYDGLIDEALIYDTELTQSDVTFRYNGGSGREDNGGYDITKGWYVRTNTNQIDTSLWNGINDISIDETTPINTEIRYLVSFDNRVTWNAWNSGWTGVILSDIDTTGNTSLELEVLDDDDWGLLFTAGTFDIVSSLKTTDDTLSPKLTQVTINYILPGKIKCKDSEVTITLNDSTSTYIENISGEELTNLQAKIVIYE